MLLAVSPTFPISIGIARWSSNSEADFGFLLLTPNIKVGFKSKSVFTRLFPKFIFFYSTREIAGVLQCTHNCIKDLIRTFFEFTAQFLKVSCLIGK